MTLLLRLPGLLQLAAGVGGRVPESGGGLVAAAERLMRRRGLVS